ncbi:MAG: hypothetical protein EF812_05425 [Methanosarcinales archaeon]|nr:MAG: hypothetical protein EF812_05425 [Methanosarcinales archaeon]
MSLIGDDIDYKELNRLVASADRILKGYDFIRLRKVDEYDRMEMWNRIEENRKKYEEDFVSELEDDLVQSISSKFSLASLLLAAAADTNHEESPIINKFNRVELDLVEDFERFKVFDILSVKDAIDKIKRKEGGLYELIVDYYEKQYSDLDKILESLEIRRDLQIAFRDRYLKRQRKIEEIISVAVKERLIDPSKIRKAIEKTVLDRVKESEKLRKHVTEESHARIDELESKLEELESIEDEKLLLEEQLSRLETDFVKEGIEKESALKMLKSVESDRNNLNQRYAGIVQLLDEKMREIEENRKELDDRKKDLEGERDEYRKQMKEEKERIIESELEEIDELKNELQARENALMDEKRDAELKKNEIAEKLEQITDAISGKSIRFVTQDDAKLYELNYISRFDAKIHQFPLKLYNPLERKNYTITSWKNHYRSDSKEEIFTADAMYNAEIEAKNPLNLRSTYIVEKRSLRLIGERVKKIVIEAVSYNHLKSYADYGFDTNRTTLSEFLITLSNSIKRAEVGKYLHVIGIASPTGWDERVISEIRSSEFAHNYMSRYVSVCLTDSVTGNVYYNEADERIAGYIEFFKPEFDSERVERVKKHVLNIFKMKDYAVLTDVIDETGEGRSIVNKAFYDLAGDGEGKTRYIKDVGMVIEL